MPDCWNFVAIEPFEILTKDALEEMWRDQNELVMKEWHPDDIKNLPDSAIFIVERNGDIPLPDQVAEILFPHISWHTNEIEIEIAVNGSFIPGVRYTRNGDGWPDDFDEDRVITAVTVGDKSFTEADTEFSKLAELLYDLLDIDEIEFDPDLYESEYPEE